jgi:cellulose synthase operon protein C
MESRARFAGARSRALCLSLSCGLALLSLSVAACAHPQKPAEAPRPIDILRERAANAPNDKEIWHELAIAEHLYDGGEPKRAREALARARTLGASSLRLTFIEAEEHVLEAHPKEALDAYLRVLQEAPGQSDPLAAWLAESSFSALSDMNDAVDDYRTRLRSALSVLEQKRDKIGLTASHQLSMQELAQALLDGDLARATAATKSAGCVQKVEVAGPFGPRELLGFDGVLDAEKPGPLAKEYALGFGRGTQPTRTIETRRCVLGLGRGAHDALAGTSVARSELNIANAGAYALRVESPNSFVLWLDGREIARSDLRKQHPFGVRYLPVDLSQGAHELKVKVSSRHPNPAVSLALVPASRAAIEQTTLPEPRDALSRYLAAKLALSRGDAVSARELMRALPQKAPSAHWLVLEAAAGVADPLRSKEQRRDRARDLLRRAEKANPAAWYPAVGLANLEAAEGRTKEAIEALRSASTRYPAAIAIKTTLAEHLRQRGYVEEADRIVDQLRKQMPHACAVLGLSLSGARARGRMAEVERLMPETLACDATSNARFGLLRAQRKYAEAAQELLRIQALSDPFDASQALEAELEHARLAGDLVRERQLREARSAMWLDRPEPVLDKADLLLAAGKRQEAVRYLAEAIEKNPDNLFELTRTQEALGGAELFRDYRKSGTQVIKAFEAKKPDYTEPEVLVLDYTVVRIFPDGSSADLTHNILRMQSQESVDRNGEFAVPDGARLLSLHTVKADGRRLEPDPIPEKTTWSLPNLSLGDYVEFETVRGEGPSLGFPGGYLGNRFYFKSFEVPFDHTELVVILPEGMEPVIDPRGPAPKVVKESKNGMTVLRWAEHESRPMQEEPGSVATREYVPSINLGIKASFDQYVESMRDLLSDKDVFDPEAKELADKLIGDPSAPPSVRAEKLFRFVTDQIEPTDEVFGGAAAMLSARTGSRERVLRYLLTLAGVESEFALVRGAESDHTTAQLPDPETYGYFALRVSSEKGPLWLHAGARHAPFGFLPPQLRNEEALLLNAQAEKTRTPEARDTDTRRVDAKISLTKEGKAEIAIRETHRGQSAVSWRNDLDEVPEAELTARFDESYAANVMPGERLKSLSFEQRDEPEAPLVIAYTLEIESLGHRVGDELRIPPLLAASLQSSFARRDARTTTALIAPGANSTIQITVEAPEGGKLQTMPKASKASFGKASFELAVASDGPRKLTLTRNLNLPLMRVKPEEYAAFAQFCRDVDLAEASELGVALP